MSITREIRGRSVVITSQTKTLWSSRTLLNRSLLHGVKWTTFRHDWLKLWYSRMLPFRNRKKNGEKRLAIVPLTDCIPYVNSSWLHSVHSAAQSILRAYTLYMRVLKVHWIVKLRLLTPTIPVYFREWPENLISHYKSFAYTRIYWNRRLRVTSRY